MTILALTLRMFTKKLNIQLNSIPLHAETKNG
jgi:hypothetical protein